MKARARRSDWQVSNVVNTAPWLVLADNGCDLAPSCLSCPFEVCRYDRPDGIAGLRREERDAEIGRLREAGQSLMVIAAQVGVSLRSVYRIVRGRV